MFSSKENMCLKIRLSWFSMLYDKLNKGKAIPVQGHEGP
jgi:hypothetical protein